MGLAQSLKARPYLYDVRSSYHSRLQLCLCAKCRFVLGCSSGAAFMGTFFGKPVALSNLIPVTTMPFTKNDLGLHKRIVDVHTGRELSIFEALESPVADGFVSSMYGAQYTHFENESGDILRLAKAMINQIDGRKTNAFSIEYKPTDYAYKTLAKIIS